MRAEDDTAVHRRVGLKGFDSSSVLRVATDRQDRPMTDWKPETHASVTVERTEAGNIRYIKVRAEYYEAKETPEGEEDEFAEGVNARYKFGVTGGDLAHLEGVKDISDDAPSGYTTSMDFIRTLPVAEQAVLNVPGIEEVADNWGAIADERQRGLDAATTTE